MTWQYLLSDDSNGLQTVTVYKNGSEVATLKNGDHPDVDDSDFSGFSVEKIKDLMHSQAEQRRQQASAAYENGNVDGMLGHINNWMEIIGDAAFEQIEEVENPP